MDICRICMNRAKEQEISLFTEDEKSQEILEKIYLCFKIVLKFNNYLPNIVCSKCINELNIAYSFRNKCLTFEEKFKDYCQQLITNDDECFTPDNQEISNLLGEKLDDKILVGKGIETKEFKCETCQKTLKTGASLTRHKITMHLNRKHVGKVTGCGASRRYHCNECSYSTPHSQTLVNHMRTHDGERPYVCSCGKSFTQSSSLAAHSKTHSSTTYFTCSICGKQFKHAFALKNHSRVHDIGMFSCSICQKVLKSRQSLLDHVHRHYDIRNYNCEDCGETFITSAELLNHRKRHSIEKKVECHLCGYKTNRKKTLVVHLKRHAGDKSFKCVICEEKFYTKSDLKRHGRVHTHEKPFSCPACSQQFTHSPSLNKHMRNIHSIDFKWGECKEKIIKIK